MNPLLIRGVLFHPEKLPADSYVRSIEALQSSDRIEFETPVTFFTGENGSGKSTLLEAMAVACGFSAEGGTKNYRFSTRDTHSDLYEAITVQKGPVPVRWGYFLRAESFYNTATMEEEYSDSDHPSRQYHMKSHGESFLSLAMDSFQSQGIYFLDEPEAALSAQRQMSLLVTIHDAVKAGAQFIIATHSPILTGYPGASILSFDHGEIRKIRYEETESYRLTKLFIEHRDRILRELLDESTSDE